MQTIPRGDYQGRCRHMVHKGRRSATAEPERYVLLLFIAGFLKYQNREISTRYSLQTIHEIENDIFKTIVS